MLLARTMQKQHQFARVKMDSSTTAQFSFQEEIAFFSPIKFNCELLFCKIQIDYKRHKERIKLERGKALCSNSGSIKYPQKKLVKLRKAASKSSTDSNQEKNPTMHQEQTCARRKSLTHKHTNLKCQNSE